MNITQEVIGKIIRNVMTALYEPFWAAILLSFMAMFAFLYAKEHGYKMDNCFLKLIRVWCDEFRNSSTFRRAFLLVFYTTMILFRTVLNRQIWFDPLGKIMEGWGIYDADGNLTTESIENFMLFVPFSMLFLWAFSKQMLGKKVYLKAVIWKCLKIVGTFALGIELIQVLFHLGTFQLSDLFYNTLGGMLGGFVYWVLQKNSKI